MTGELYPSQDPWRGWLGQRTVLQADAAPEHPRVVPINVQLPPQIEGDCGCPAAGRLVEPTRVGLEIYHAP